MVDFGLEVRLDLWRNHGTSCEYVKKKQGFSRCRTAPRCGFSIFEITRFGSVCFLGGESYGAVRCGYHFQKHTVRCGAVRIAFFKHHTVRWGAVIR